MYELTVREVHVGCLIIEKRCLHLLLKLMITHSHPGGYESVKLLSVLLACLLLMHHAYLKELNLLK